MSNRDADRVANLKIFISNNVKVKREDGSGPSHETKSARCSVPVHFTWITPENCRSLASFLTEEKMGAPSTSIMDPMQDITEASAGDAFSLLMQGPEDKTAETATEIDPADGIGDGFQFSDDEGEDQIQPDEPESVPGKRDRLEIASAASDMLFETIPSNLSDLPVPLQEEFHHLRTIPVVSKSQEARISTIEDQKQTPRKKWVDLDPDTPRNARFSYDIDWDVFMPNLGVLGKAQMLMIGSVGFASMFKPVLGANKKSLSHTERILEDIAKNTNMPRDRIFLKIPFPGAKKKDGCRAIPFGFFPLVLHYLRPASLRGGIELKKTRSLLLKCYRDVSRYFAENAPPIVKRQLRQFAFNMSTSILGSMGDPTALLSVRSGAVDSDVTAEDISIETISESHSEEEQDVGHFVPPPLSPASDPAEKNTEKKKRKKKKKKTKKKKKEETSPDASQLEPSHDKMEDEANPWPGIGEHDFSDVSDSEIDPMDTGDDESDEDLDGFVVDTHDVYDDLTERPRSVDESSMHRDLDSSMEDEDEDVLGEEDSMDIESQDDSEPRHRTGFLREQLLEMRYNCHTDDELDALISHHLAVLAELNEVRRMRRVSTRSLREKLQARAPVRPMYRSQKKRMPAKRNKKSRRGKAAVKPSRKRKRQPPAVESGRNTTRDHAEIEEARPPPKRTAASSSVDTNSTQKPKKKLRVYRMQGMQLTSSIPTALAWTESLISFVRERRPGFEQAMKNRNTTSHDDDEPYSDDDGDDDEYDRESASLSRYDDDDDDDAMGSEESVSGESLGSRDSDDDSSV